jgi:streptomycin 6-kinase
VRRLSDFAADLLDRVPRALTLGRDPSEHSLIKACASALEEVLAEAGDRLLHEDLHHFNILAPLRPEQREPWLAIDPNPLAGDPGFVLLPALHNRWEEAVATGDVPRAIRRRFDLMTNTLGLDRQRATNWTLARILQNALWEVEHDDTIWHTGPDRAIAHTLLDNAGQGGRASGGRSRRARLAQRIRSERTRRGSTGDRCLERGRRLGRPSPIS